MEPTPTFVAFAGPRLIAEGAPPAVLALLKQRFDADRGDAVLVFDVDTGRQLDFDLRGSLEEVIAREAPAPVRGPGRPKLGVVSREVTLMPQHWQWLEQQPRGTSATLRLLVDQAMKANPGHDRARRARAALARMLTALAGDRPHFEDAARALFAGEVDRFEEHVARWPKDLRSFAVRQARSSG